VEELEVFEFPGNKRSFSLGKIRAVWIGRVIEIDLEYLFSFDALEEGVFAEEAVWIVCGWEEEAIGTLILRPALGAF